MITLENAPVQLIDMENVKKKKSRVEIFDRTAQKIEEINFIHRRRKIRKHPSFQEVGDALFLATHFASLAGREVIAIQLKERIHTFTNSHRPYNPFLSPHELVRSIAGATSAIQAVKKRFQISQN